VEIKYEFVPASMVSLMGEKWSIANNPLFIAVFIAVFIAAQAQESTLVFNHVAKNSYLNDNPTLKDKIARRGIYSWLLVSLITQGKLVGMLKLHHGVKDNFDNFE
jgi:transcriptional regulator with GAF, ATPase, and Fis domain